MAYDEETASRLRDMTDGLPGISEKKMMGGLCFMLNGHMIGGASGTKSGVSRFMFRVGKSHQTEADALPGGEPMVHGGRRMSGFYFVPAEDCSDDTLHRWVSLAVDNALSLPPKDT